MTASTGTKVTITIDDGFLGRTGVIAEVDDSDDIHAKCTDTHYFVDIDATDEFPAWEHTLFHSGDFA